MQLVPALNVVVYREPGPADEDIDRQAARFVEAKSVVPLGGRLGYLVLVPSDFDRLWDGVDAGDAMGTAASVLQFLGPETRQFIARPAQRLPIDRHDLLVFRATQHGHHGR